MERNRTPKPNGNGRHAHSNGNGHPFPENGNGTKAHGQNGIGNGTRDVFLNEPASPRTGNERPLAIAQVSPLYESVPPSLYGGTERIVSYLTEELLAEGHDVTLFASGDSSTSARLVPVTPRSLRLDERCKDPLAHHILLLELDLAIEIARRSGKNLRIAAKVDVKDRAISTT